MGHDPNKEVAEPRAVHLDIVPQQQMTHLPRLTMGYATQLVNFDSSSLICSVISAYSFSLSADTSLELSEKAS